MAFTHPEHLVSTDWLAAHLDDPTVRVLDVTAKLTSKLENRAREECYDLGHIPGSIFFDVSSGRGVLSAAEEALPWMWPGPDQFSAAMADAGVGPDTHVVLVARTPRPGIDGGTMWCTRAWWTMHHFGVRCSILRGGLELWEAEGRSLTAEAPTVPTVAAVSPASGWEQARATTKDVIAGLNGSSCLIDALPPSSYDGTGTKYGPRGGHIAGAANLPGTSLIEAETALFLEPDAMEAHLTQNGLLGSDAGAPVITYCGGAIAATITAFGLALFGRTDVSVYDGSLMEWSANADLPMIDPTNEADPAGESS